jgi:mono/diheme cytochrome c family protein
MTTLATTPWQPPQRPGPGVGRPLAWAVVFLLATASTSRAIAADGMTGEQIYQTQCASCHGAAGEGTKDRAPKPLTGDRSVPQLAALIAKSMPKDDPGSCTGKDAEKVAAYIHSTFYSKEARERNRPPRIELSRLTVRQYQNTVADLIASFRTPGRIDDKRGLRGEYFDARGFRNDKRLLDRLDPEVRFDFGTDGPAEKFGASQFSIRWEGSVLAPETGAYEFVVRTEHAARLWVNDTRKPLIDAWVKSGDATEYRESIFLVAGRAYPLRLEFSKAKQGVDDKNPKPAPPVQASVALLWKPPQGSVEVIPSRHLTPNRFPETCVVQTSFPPDDRSLGWERATTISKAWDQAATDAALETAAYVAAHLSELAGTRDDARDRDAKAREFCRRFAERAFRRPLTDEQKRLFIDRQFDAAAGDAEKAVQRVVILVLKSPRFLYREVGGGPDAYDVASRLSFALWDSLPDEQLLAAAAAGKLSTREQVAAQAEQMLNDPRARAKLREFFLRWLKVEQAPEIAKDPARFPGFDAAVVADLRTSLELFLEDVAWGDDPDFRRLLLADELPLNGRLAKFYGAKLPADAPFQYAKLNPEQRAGVLTHPYLLAAFAYTGATSPIHRGVFVTRGVLGVALRPPPEAFTPLAEDLHPKLTTRERVMLQTKPNSCQSCHGVINPLGFTLERFDAVGRYREQDNGKPIDATGTYETRQGEVVKFTGARELAKFLAGSEEVHTAFVEHLFHHLVKQPIRAYGPRQSAKLRDSLAANRFNIRKLMVEIATTAAIRGQESGVRGQKAPP